MLFEDTKSIKSSYDSLIDPTEIKGYFTSTKKSESEKKQLSQKDVTLFDYDGTILYAYTAEEFSTLSQLPKNPVHEGLLAQGWNWSLTDAKNYVEKHGRLNIGQMYITNDRKTRLYVTILEGATHPILQLYLNDNTQLDVDWGDGTPHSTLSSVTADYVDEEHIYTNSGEYVITITVIEGSFSFKSSSTVSSTILWHEDEITGSTADLYARLIKRVEIGENASLGSYAFYACYALETITIPNSITIFEDHVFQSCRSLKSIVISNSVTELQNYCFNNCMSLKTIVFSNSIINIASAFGNTYLLTSVTIPDSVTTMSCSFSYASLLNSITLPDEITTIPYDFLNSCSSIISIIIPDKIQTISNAAFKYCYALESIILPNTLTNIGANAFGYCNHIKYIKFKSTTVPTVANRNAWSGISEDAIILVPLNSWDSYVNGTNYPDSSSFKYIAYNTYALDETLPSTATDETTSVSYTLTWYATMDDAANETNPITKGNGEEVYARCVVNP